MHFQELQRAQEDLVKWLRLMMTPLLLNCLEIIKTPQSNVLLIQEALLGREKFQTLGTTQQTIYLSILSRKKARRRKKERMKEKLEWACSQTQLCELRCFNDYN